MGSFVDWSGHKFSRWTVLQRVTNGHAGQTRWLCRCECGTKKTVMAGNLTRRISESCGCLSRERNTKHGMTNTRLHRVWRSLRERCNNPRSRDYPKYGGRGIKVCNRWNDFENFAADMGERPSDRLSIDRINNHGHYEPGNCRWATTKQQLRNTRQNRLLTFCGETRPLIEWSEITGVAVERLRSRIKRGWPVERAFINRSFCGASPPP